MNAAPPVGGGGSQQGTSAGRDRKGVAVPGVCDHRAEGRPGSVASGARPLGDDTTRRGPRVFTHRNAKFAYWALARNPAAALHMARVLLRAARSAVLLWARVRWSRDRRPVLAIALLEHIGDIVAAEPIARLARETYPGHRVFWITRAANQPLVRTYAAVDRVVTVGCLTEWMLLWRLGLTDIVWDLHVKDRICDTCAIPLQKRDGLPDLGTYYSFGNLLDVECLCAGLPKLAAGPRINPPAGARAAIDAIRLPGRFIAIHCRSNDPRRDWPADHWRRLVGRILETWDIDVIEVGMRPIVATAAAERVRNLCGTLSILETAEVIRRAALFVGIDSGPAHLANAVGTPGVLLLGDYVNFRRYMPYSGGYQDGRNADVLYAEGTVAELEVETVFTTLARRLPQ